MNSIPKSHVAKGSKIKSDGWKGYSVKLSPISIDYVWHQSTHGKFLGKYLIHNFPNSVRQNL